MPRLRPIVFKERRCNALPKLLAKKNVKVARRNKGNSAQNTNNRRLRKGANMSDLRPNQEKPAENGKGNVVLKLEQALELLRKEIREAASWLAKFKRDKEK
jgi:hypothetical protein